MLAVKNLAMFSIESKSNRSTDSEQILSYSSIRTTTDRLKCLYKNSDNSRRPRSIVSSVGRYFSKPLTQYFTCHVQACQDLKNPLVFTLRW